MVPTAFFVVVYVVGVFFRRLVRSFKNSEPRLEHWSSQPVESQTQRSRSPYLLPSFVRAFLQRLSSFLPSFRDGLFLFINLPHGLDLFIDTGSDLACEIHGVNIQQVGCGECRINSDTTCWLLLSARLTIAGLSVSAAQAQWDEPGLWPGAPVLTWKQLLRCVGQTSFQVTVA